ncbi:MAG TPA: type II toxin-antitoxin system death-on-curing family toxin [Kofleriaceae bacterium]|nr:type II toxin-antitoxin system death-on-curing family toxin [Kofleriaceae bacterium]
MKRSSLFLTLEEVLELHRELLRRFGGTDGVRDLGLLESALARPRTGYYETLSLQAAALLQSLCQNHAFVFADCNKRVAFAATAIFLRINGYRLVVSADDGEEFLIHRAIIGRASLEEIASFIERFLVYAPPEP